MKTAPVKTALSAALLALSLSAAAPALASSDMAVTAEVKARITEKLTAEGYEVGKIKTEKGMYEAYARKDGQRIEVLLDADLNIVRTEIDD